MEALGPDAAAALGTARLLMSDVTDVTVPRQDNSASAALEDQEDQKNIMERSLAEVGLPHHLN